ncbi:MAG: hypothetical protein WC546_05375 [Candidatus Omnitrophota bacterium]
MALFKFFKNLFRARKKKRTTKRKIKSPLRRKANKSRTKTRKHSKKTAKRISFKKAKRPSKKIKLKIKKKKTKPVRTAKAYKEKEIGIITHYFDKISVGIIKLKAPLVISEHIHIKGKNTDFTQVVSSMQYNHKDITLAERGIEIGIKVIKPVHENDTVSKV